VVAPRDYFTGLAGGNRAAILVDNPDLDS